MSVRFDGEAWRVERTFGTGICAEFVTPEDAEAFARRLARMFAPCWVRLYTRQGAFYMAYRVREDQVALLP